MIDKNNFPEPPSPLAPGCLVKCPSKSDGPNEIFEVIDSRTDAYEITYSGDFEAHYRTLKRESGETVEVKTEFLETFTDDIPTELEKGKWLSIDGNVAIVAYAQWAVKAGNEQRTLLFNLREYDPRKGMSDVITLQHDPKRMHPVTDPEKIAHAEYIKKLALTYDRITRVFSRAGREVKPEDAEFYFREMTPEYFEEGGAFNAMRTAFRQASDAELYTMISRFYLQDLEQAEREARQAARQEL